MKTVKDYIGENWHRAVRYIPEDNGTLLGLPKPFSIPCISGMYQELYYWDTYFVNLGLIASGNVEQAQNNVDNMLYLVERYGFMPNGSRSFYLNRSQPPFLSQMVRELWEATGDTRWLARKAYPAIAREYAYWQTNRVSGNGLNHYGTTETEKETLEEYGRILCERFGITQPEDPARFQSYGSAMLAVAESGWDCTSRFRMETPEYDPVDLNALLYLLEENMEFFSRVLGNDEEATLWQARKLARKRSMDDLCWNDDRGAYCDYHRTTGKQSPLFSAASFYPLFAGMCGQKQAEQVRQKLSLLERTWGIACCEERTDLLHLQWDYPNGWACIHYIVAQGLLRWGFRKDARRIMEKFVKLTEHNFEKTGNLWEKYDVVTGTVSTAKEYETPPMMGWTAGVYLAFQKRLETWPET